MNFRIDELDGKIKSNYEALETKIQSNADALERSLWTDFLDRIGILEKTVRKDLDLTSNGLKSKMDEFDDRITLNYETIDKNSNTMTGKSKRTSRNCLQR